MYITTWISKRTAGLCEFATREEAEAQELRDLLAAAGFQASMESEAETYPPDLDLQEDIFNPGYRMSGEPLDAA